MSDDGRRWGIFGRVVGGNPGNRPEMGVVHRIGFREFANKQAARAAKNEKIRDQLGVPNLPVVYRFFVKRVR